MASPSYHEIGKNYLMTFQFFTTIFLSFAFAIHSQTLNVSYDNIAYAANDYGGIYHNMPLSVAYPQSVHEISYFIKKIYASGNLEGLTVAARGNGHSTQGQAQANKGMVFDMTSLKKEGMKFHIDDVSPYVDVSAGTFWKNVLIESLRYGYAPKAWTDYLYLTVGGTLSNAGFGGQSFRHGPQIDNVNSLEVVTGKGKIYNCSRDENSDLFYGVLGGLGQFGIITRARIPLEPAPIRVKWIRAVYEEFASFSKDQEHLIASEDTFDYIEGFVLPNQPTGLNSMKTKFELEVAKYYNPNEILTTSQKLVSLVEPLNYTRGTLTVIDVSYMEFLDRVHTSEMELRKFGLWEVTHPWLNLLIPKTSIDTFVAKVFGSFIIGPVNGPILIYPANKNKWQNQTSLVTPEEDIFYLVALLYAAPPLPMGQQELDKLLLLNKQILDYCKEAKLGVKQYLPHYTTQQDWKDHFGPHWDAFAARKSTYDPLNLLAPGQMIFQSETPPA